MVKNPMLDKDFLKALDNITLKELYAEVIALNSKDEVLENITGRITQGSINIDGTSAVRRTCSLTIVAEELNIHEYYWGLHTKFDLRVGVKNTIDPEYPDIIWFKQGIFVISNFTTTQGLSNYTIAIQGKDKMTLLNGEFGGAITSLTHDFGKVLEITPEGYSKEFSLELKDIIKSAVHQFANEPFYNIIVEDLDDYGLELMEYRGSTPLYFLINNNDDPENMTLDGNMELYDENGNPKAIGSLEETQYNPLFNLEVGNAVDYTILRDEKGNRYSVAKIEYGQTAGYRLTSLTYPGDLILNVGETITSLLDRIVAMLGEFEYFYDIDGRFIFRKKKTYFNSSWNNIVKDEEEQYAQNVAYTSAVSYSFEDGLLITSYNNNPNFSNIKNDFSVWGTRKSTSGKELPIHMRYAIDKKPIFYKPINSDIIYSSIGKDETKEELLKEYIENQIGPIGELKNEVKLVDWRELIYLMAKDFEKYHLEEDFYLQILKNSFNIYQKGITGYEQYYIDISGFWRDLYNPEGENYAEYVPVSLKKDEYEQNYEKYFYDAINYIKVEENEGYSKYREYYSYTYDDIKGADILLRVAINSINEFNKYVNSEKGLYYIDSENPYKKETCVIIEPYRKGGIGYYKYNKNNYELQAKVEENDYKGNEQIYYYLAQTSYKPTISIKEYSSVSSFYIKVKEGEYEKVTNLLKNTYIAEPYKYYYPVKQYRVCSPGEKFNSSLSYYERISSSVTGETIYKIRVGLTEETYNKSPGLYYVEIPETYENCVKVYKPYNEVKDNLYQYVMNLNPPYEKISGIGEVDYLKTVYYYPVYTYECCKHPAPYGQITIYEQVHNFDSSGWKKDIFLYPDTLNFWFDFLGDDSELQKYSSYAIGNRPKAVNDNQVKAIYYRETPLVIFTTPENQNKDKQGYKYFNLPPNMEVLFSISSQGKTAKTVVDELVYKHICEGESITFSVLPIYHLEPNTRIFVYNKESGIEGEYILTRYSINMTNANAMSITATKAVDRLY